MADSKLYLLTPVGGGLGGGIDRPDQGLPGHGHIDNDLPGRPDRIDNDLPGRRPRIDNTLPGGGRIDHIDNSLPGGPFLPPTIDNDLPGIWPGAPIFMPPGNETLPVPPGTTWPPLPPIIDAPIVALVWILGLGYHWTVLSPTPPVITPTPPRPAVPQPK